MKKVFIPTRYQGVTYNTRIFRAYYFYITKHYSKKMFEDICSELGISEDFILADDNWVSNQFATDFIDIIKKKTNDDLICEKAGRFASSPEVLNTIEHFLITNLPFPGIFFLLLPHEYSKFNKFNSVRLINIKPGNYTFSITPKSLEEIAHPDICLNTMGMLSSTEQAYNLDAFSIKHTKCIHKGDSECVFTVKYSAKTFLYNKFLNILIFIVSNLATALLLDRVIKNKPVSILFGFILSTLIVLIKKYFKLFSYLTQYYQQNKEKSDALYKSFKKLDKRYQESNLLREFSMQIQAESKIINLSDSCLVELNKRFGYERGIVMLVSGDKTNLYTASLIGFNTNSKMISELKFNYPSKKDKPQLFANILDSQKTVLISEIETFKRQIKDENRKIIDTLDVKSMIIAPIYDSQTKFGILAIGRVNNEQPLNQDDQHLIENVCRLLSIAFKNIYHLDRERNLRELFQKYVPSEVLRSLEKNDIVSPQNMNIASMFVDLRGFTSSSENLHPDKIVNALNLYTDFVAKKIANNAGIIDKFNGDGVVSFFIDESRHGEAANKALLTAIEVLADLDGLNELFKSKGYAPITLGIGINGGLATVGSIGGEIKLNYTAVGKTVNLASRYEELTKTITAPSVKDKSKLIMSRASYDLAQIPIEHTDLGLVEIRGNSEKINLICIDKLQATDYLKRLIAA